MLAADLMIDTLDPKALAASVTDMQQAVEVMAMAQALIQTLRDENQQLELKLHDAEAEVEDKRDFEALGRLLVSAWDGTQEIEVQLVASGPEERVGLFFGAVAALRELIKARKAAAE